MGLFSFSDTLVVTALLYITWYVILSLFHLLFERPYGLAQANQELTLLLEPPECWDCRHA